MMITIKGEAKVFRYKIISDIETTFISVQID